MMEPASARGKLQLLCGPIGNLGDITYRAVEALRTADLIACEDTRHSRKLLQHYDVEGKELISLHEHNEKSRSEQLASRIADSGGTIVVLTDAGTPTIADPGYRIVQECVIRGIPVEVLPGPSAIITALAASGLATDSFYFGGFLPVKSGKKQRIIQEALERKSTSIFYESPHRIAKTLHVICDLDSTRKLCVARELTKRHETYHRGIAADLVLEFPLGQKAKGEITLLIEGLVREKKKRKPMTDNQ